MTTPGVTPLGVLHEARLYLPAGSVELACHAAVPVALDTGFLHLLRINFFQDPPEVLPYEAEAALLTSPLFQELGDGLFEVDPVLRDRLLAGLTAAYGHDRLTGVAVLLEQYTNRADPWPLRELDHAQRLTALSVVHPDRAATWLAEAASTSAAATDPLAKEWFVAMQARLERRPPDLEAEIRPLLDANDPRQLGELAMVPGADVLAIARHLEARSFRSEAAEVLRQVLAAVPPPRSVRHDPVPQHLPLLRMLNAHDLGDADLAQLRERTGRDELRVPIGIDRGSLVELDIKEPAQGGMGPHGMLIGATGSGKTELLRTLVLALAITHPPATLTFAFVDIMGGSGFRTFDRLPHTVALMTGLNVPDPGYLVRSVLTAEITRRQGVLARSRQATQREHQRVARADPTLEPLPTLLIVIDEYAELLTAMPDFVNMLVSIGRVGRSLGVHLLLSGQRLDAGRLRGLDTYLSYRIALRMFSAEESRTFLGDGRAAELPAEPGHGILRVSWNNQIPFRAAYISAPRGPGPTWDELLEHTPRETEAEWVVDRLTAHDRPAPRIHPLPTSMPNSLGDVLGPAGRVDERGFQLLDHHLWRINELPVAVSKHDRSPAEAVRRVRTDSSAAIVGPPSSGRRTALQTLVCGLALTRTPDEAEIHLIDLNDTGLTTLGGLPHVRTAARKMDVVAIYRAFAEIDALMGRRSQLESRTRSRTYLVISGVHELHSRFPDLSLVLNEIQSSRSGGVHTITTYEDRLPVGRGFPAGANSIRLTGEQLVGLDEVVPLLPQVTTSAGPTSIGTVRISELARQHWRGSVAPAPRMPPEIVDYESVTAEPGEGLNIPVGLDLLDPDLAVASVALDKGPGLVISGDRGSGRTSLLRSLMKTIDQRFTAATAVTYTLGKHGVFKDVRDTIRRFDRSPGRQIFIVADDYADDEAGGLMQFLELLPRAAELHFRLVITRGAGEPVGPVIGAMKELRCAQMVMSGSRSGGLTPVTLPSGVGRLLQADPRGVGPRPVRTLQLGYLPAAEA
ncbi:FtsK/SpoIIIE domain-containing protein [Actinoplanes sp. NBRC 103695]|uniref:FtsK/SpoIIIE domain-containing protein n=1 Tax=Actinoplanes sp. NBRC 103695 TaxID=3032202 RepID=UPI0024A4A635|nr:FtsK/SpoIIIE domain-containing protein [Actinoplanes sp. NBRC 103695]GLY92932.1 hypothetical protein Acsp02_01880 [Actinoplanes sp. NBRC 103695]